MIRGNRRALSLSAFCGAILGTLSALANAGLLHDTVYVPKVLGTAYLWLALAMIVAWTAPTGREAAIRSLALLAVAVLLDTGVDYALDTSIVTSLPYGVSLWQVVAADLWWLVPAVVVSLILGVCVGTYRRGGVARLIVAVPPAGLGLLALRDLGYL